MVKLIYKNNYDCTISINEKEYDINRDEWTCIKKYGGRFDYPSDITFEDKIAVQLLLNEVFE